MSKIIALYINEMIKISRKVSVIVILAIMVVGVIGFGGLMKLQENSMKNSDQGNSEEKFMIDNMKQILSDNETTLASIEEKIKNADSDELVQLQQEKESITSQINTLKLAIEKNISIYSDDYRSNALKNIGTTENNLAELKKIPIELLSDENKKMISYYENIIPRLNKIIDNNDFEEYINIKNEEINNNTMLSDNEKKISLESNALRLKYDITNDGSNGIDVKNHLLTQIESGKLSLLNNIDYTASQGGYQSLTPKLRDKITNDLAINTYKLENNIVKEQNGLSPKSIAVTGMFQLGSFLIIILILILAGGAVSQEMSSGSIKSLIISPAKRWKIFTAKVMSLLTIGLITTMILYVIATISNGILFGFDSGASYIYATGGVAHELNFYLHQFLYVLTSIIDIIVYMMFALMLSIITRNTAVSVGISIALFFGGSIVNAFILQFFKGEWIKFIPFNNLDMATKIFPPEVITQVSAMNMGITTTTNSSLMFSLSYIAVILFCMGYIALDSFNRRDIR